MNSQGRLGVGSGVQRPYFLMVSLAMAQVVQDVGVPMFWQGWQYQKMRQHRTTFGPQDLALLGPKRDLSMIVKLYLSLNLECYDARLVMGLGVCLFDCFVWLLVIRKEGFSIRPG